MEIRDVSSMKGYANKRGNSAQVTQLYPVGPANGLVAVDLWEIEPGGQTSLHAHAEEHVLFVLEGEGEIAAGQTSGASARVARDVVVHVGPREAHVIRNTGTVLLRILAATPLLVRSERMMGMAAPQVAGGETQAASSTPAAEAPSPRTSGRQRTPAPVAEPQRVAETAPEKPGAVPATDTPAAEPAGAEPVPDISTLMKRGSDMVGAPRTERRRPSPEPEPAPVGATGDEGTQAEEDEEGRSDLMELFVAFDGGSRGNPGQGYGSYLVQSPGRKPVIKRVEFGDNYTNNQAEYDTLISCIEYIIARLEATGRTGQQVQLDIRSDSDLLVNQVLGNYKVKEAGLRKRHEQVTSLLEQFADWRIEWHPREESVRLLGH